MGGAALLANELGLALGHDSMSIRHCERSDAIQI
jgi:hypothetical protein